MSWDSRLIRIALIAGLSVAIVYVAQPMLTLIADDFSITPATASIASSLSLVGYAVGVLTLIALSDRLQARNQVVEPILGQVRAAQGVDLRHELLPGQGFHGVGPPRRVARHGVVTAPPL